jgi:hypothetical protein
VIIAPRQTGTGDTSFGPFTVRGNFMFYAACTGHGSMSVVVPQIERSGGIQCGGDPQGSQISGLTAHGARLHVHAAPGAKWEIEIGECVKHRHAARTSRASCETT